MIKLLKKGLKNKMDNDFLGNFAEISPGPASKTIFLKFLIEELKKDLPPHMQKTYLPVHISVGSKLNLEKEYDGIKISHFLNVASLWFGLKFASKQRVEEMRYVHPFLSHKTANGWRYEFRAFEFNDKLWDAIKELKNLVSSMENNGPLFRNLFSKLKDVAKLYGTMSKELPWEDTIRIVLLTPDIIDTLTTTQEKDKTT